MVGFFRHLLFCPIVSFFPRKRGMLRAVEGFVGIILKCVVSISGYRNIEIIYTVVPF